MADDAKPNATPAAPKGEQPKLRGLQSRLNHPTTLSYGDDVIIVPARGRVYNVDQAQLGALPNGVLLIPNVEG